MGEPDGAPDVDVRPAEERGPVDVGQGYMLDYIQTLNAGTLYDKLAGAAAAARH